MERLGRGGGRERVRFRDLIAFLVRQFLRRVADVPWNIWQCTFSGNGNSSVFMHLGSMENRMI